MLATLAVCAAGGLIVGSIAGGTFLFARGRSAAASAAPEPASLSLPGYRVDGMPGRVEEERFDAIASLERERLAMEAQFSRRQESMLRAAEARHARIRDQMERMRASAMELPPIEAPNVQEFAPPQVRDFPTVVPHDEFSIRVSSEPRTRDIPIVRPPLIERPLSVSYSRSVPRTNRFRAAPETPAPSRWIDPDEVRLQSLRSLADDPYAFSSEASWFVRRRSTLSDEMALRIEETIAEFIYQAASPDTVSVLPRLLNWYGQADLPALARLFLRLAELDDGTASIEQRQTVVGTLQRYRRLDEAWNRTTAAEILRAMRRSRTVGAHFVPTLESLQTPYCPEIEAMLLEIAFDGTPDAACAQRQALRSESTRDRLLDLAIANLESPDAVQRDAAYMVLAATEPTTTHAGAAIDALAHAFANQSLEPSPMAHTALVQWVDEGNASRFDEFCDCDCPIRRTASRAAIGRFGIAIATGSSSTE